MEPHHFAVAVASTTAVGVLVSTLLALGRRGWLRPPVDAPGTCADRGEFDAALARLRRSARFVGVVVVDLGGAPPDEATTALEQVIRGRDVLLPTGSGFVLLLPGCPAGQVASVARRVEAAIESADAAWVGVAHGPGLDLMDVLRAADEDLRRSRRRLVVPAEAG